ncbi:bifunctional proline dehydrogenase/L-glutamate gamma-semialdehyde dehydrogenase [Prosthecobacter sp. SYSU 5D2]|uniref:bifunctional proline dehydrogenase/L-glutamate gamma-semialdehyde dehydrogenase n=1 Tax=Prosthecobacter sp. SYSU 5D2 TaxID=3134134 RepID=UPI0031FF19B3
MTISSLASTPPSSLLPTNEISVNDELCHTVVQCAEVLLTSALRQQTSSEHSEAAKLGRLMNDPRGKAFTFAMVDEVFRSHDAATSARRWRGLIRVFGIPHFLPLLDRLLIKLGALGSLFLPKAVMKAVAARMRMDSARVILPGEKEPLHRYLISRSSEGFRINLNHLGEAVLGEEEAKHRLEAVLGHLADPAVNYISVKISAIFSQINLVAWDQTLTAIKDRLRLLFRAAKQGGKFVNLDMEEYRDLALTMAAFQEVLDEGEFHQLSAGIVLQAYLPDSFSAMQSLSAWAGRRVAEGGSPIKIRIVKGANLAMENVEAEMHGWHRAPYQTKAETDANFRRLLEFGCDPLNAKAVRLGVASHNLFDVALALTLRKRNGVTQQVEIEMLEGMANHQARAVRDAAGGLLLYAPAVQTHDFLSAMAYLVRRLDENTAPENFLRDMFAMRPGSVEWEAQKQRFIQGWNERMTVSAESRRDRPAVDPGTTQTFENEPDSDWTQPATRTALDTAIRAWTPEALPSLPDLEVMLQSAAEAQQGWEGLGISGRAGILNRVADLMSAQRFESLACLRVDGKKAINDADGEVSEAIDFARYYARTAEAPAGVKAEALGIVAVVSPWNFPYAIPAGGVLAALMAGNSVVFKPARATSQIAWLMVKQLWAAGVPRGVLHFFPCDGKTGRTMLTDSRIAGVILTGGYETARMFQSWRPSLPLYAETSGKNSLIITAQADRELAIKDLVRSAFGHSGQKCSAASLAILEAEVYDDPAFRRQLRDAAASLHAGPATDPSSIVTPLVVKPGDDLQRALTTLDEGEEWLLEPRQFGDDPCAWTPGIKLGVKPRSWFHLTECFGPVLGLMRAASLAEATEWQNATDFGLTAGIHSLDPEEVAWWRDRAQAGNLYINRPITGAIVQRQPFGGWKKSCIGPGAKAGGPNYVLSFCHLSDADVRDDDYRAAWSTHFTIEHDPSALRCESNVFRYRPSRGVILRLDGRDEKTIQRAKLAAQITGTPLTLSLREEENDSQFIARLPTLAKDAEFIRTISTPSGEVLSAAYEAGLNWINAPLLASGRIELTRWLREQAVSETRHRYGQLPDPATARRG